MQFIISERLQHVYLSGGKASFIWARYTCSEMIALSAMLWPLGIGTENTSQCPQVVELKSYLGGNLLFASLAGNWEDMSSWRPSRWYKCLVKLLPRPETILISRLTIVAVVMLSSLSTTLVVKGDECHLTPVVHVLEYPGCIPKPIPSFACAGKCTSYVQVST